MLHFTCVCDTCDQECEIGVEEPTNPPEVCPICGSADTIVQPLEDLEDE